MFDRKRLIALAATGALLVPAATVAQDEAADVVDCSAFQAGAVVHFMGPYTQQLLDGAKAAADECGANIVTAGPPAFDTQQQVTLFQDIVAGGADAVVNVAYPA